MSERILTKNIKLTLTRLGWGVVKIAGGPMQTTGIPDILAIRNGNYLWIEVKTPLGQLTKRQSFFHQFLKDNGCFVIVARSVDDVTRFIGMTF